MNKRILIASLFAILMLLVPMASVVGVSDVEEDCGCQVVNRYDLVRVKLLLVRIKVFTNILLLRFGYIPEVAEKCNEILDVIKSNRQLDFPIICDILEPIYDALETIVNFLMPYFEIYCPEYSILCTIILTFLIPFGTSMFTIGEIAQIFSCDWI